VTRLLVLCVGLGLLGACAGDIDPPWQLDHDRVIAVRATPPRIVAGGSATLDALIGVKGDKTRVAPPEVAAVVSPQSLADTLVPENGGWVLHAPGEDRLVAARTELKLDAGAPVPVTIGVAYNNQTLLATKTIVIGETWDNPSLASVMINDMPAGSSQITVAPLVRVSVDASDEDFDVAWLTSCGTMHDFDLPKAYLKVEKDDPTTGELAVTLRDAKGGVAWSVWPIQAE
jgi:hypothetical protein